MSGAGQTGAEVEVTRGGGGRVVGHRADASERFAVGETRRTNKTQLGGLEFAGALVEEVLAMLVADDAVDEVAAVL